jgi:cytochrome c553
MAEDQRPSEIADLWPRRAWWLTAGLLATFVVLGFVVLGREQQNGLPLGAFSAICRALGFTADIGPAGEPQPPLVTPSRIAWTPATLAAISAGNPAQGATAAVVCAACHGKEGVSSSGQFPTLAGMEAPVTYKQLDDYRAGKRVAEVMNAIAKTLSASASADVAAYFASRANGLRPIRGEPFETPGIPLDERNSPIRLAFAGDPGRGIPPCAACHGPAGNVIGAPSMQGQQPAYIERQLALFAQGSRQNDINEQMRTIAAQLTPDERHAIAEFLGTGRAGGMVGR